MPRYLFGPVSASFAEQNLGSQRRDGNCLAFGAEPGLEPTVARMRAIVRAAQ